MAKKTLTLVTGIDEEKNEVITQDYPYPIFVKGSLVKKAIDLGVELEKLGEENVDSGVVDDLADFAVELYNKQFTRDELIDGIDASDLFTKLTEILSSVMGGDGGNAQTKKHITEKKL